MAVKYKNHIGQKFGRLILLDILSGNFYNYMKKGLFRCDCGIEKEILCSPVFSGKVQSCGCLHSEIMRSRATHNLSRHPLYKRWQSIMRRCYDINHESYPNYGGRGIIVCPEWKNNPTAFIEWGIKNGFAKELEIDREDNDGNYEPDNCRFITRPQNCLNKRGTVYANYRGQTKPIKEWSIILNIPYTRLYSRIKSGWNAIDAIEMPVNEKLATYKKPPARMQRAKTNVSERVNPADALYNIHLHSPS